MEKVDLKKRFAALYRPPCTPVVTEVPPIQFLMIDGSGTPESNERFQAAIGALYGIAYTLKFMLKKSSQPDASGLTDFAVMPLEGLFGGEDAAESFMAADAASWTWTLMLALPEEVTCAHVDASREEVRRRKQPPCLDDVRFEPFAEGRCVQVMYTGPYAAEGPTIESLHQFAHEKGFALRGRHHEIYLGDPRRTAPERLKTVIRQPVQPA